MVDSEYAYWLELISWLLNINIILIFVCVNLIRNELEKCCSSLMSLRPYVTYRVHIAHCFQLPTEHIFEFEHKVMGSDRVNYINLNLWFIYFITAQENIPRDSMKQSKQQTHKITATKKSICVFLVDQGWIAWYFHGNWSLTSKFWINYFNKNMPT